MKLHFIRNWNGDQFLYEPETNTFGAYTKDGLTKTFFKPPRGQAYWEFLIGKNYIKEESKIWICRVCGFIFPERGEPPWGTDGLPSFDICDCCGVEFGFGDWNLDEIRGSREKWIDFGTKWYNESQKPATWSAERQLKNIPKEFL